MNFDEALYTFIDESRELLAEMEDCLLRVANETAPQESINAIFRAAHTIKGSAGLFGLEDIVHFTHVAESVLDEVRNGDIALSPTLVQTLLHSCDYMHALINAVEAKTPTQDAGLQARSHSLIQALEQHQQHAQTSAQPLPETAADAGAGDSHQDQGMQTWLIAVRFGSEVLQNGMDPLSFLRYLHTLGTVSHTCTLCDQLPALDALDAEQCYLGFTLHIHTSSPQQELEAVFEFVREDCELSITPIDINNSVPASLLQCATPAQPACAASSCSDRTALASTNTAAAKAPPQPAPTPPSDPAPATPLPAAMVAPAGPLHNDSAAPSAKARTQEQASVRVDAAKLDRLINLVGELITASAGATEVARQLRQLPMLEATAAVSALVEEVRDQALQLRMVKIAGTFNKFQRVVHDVSAELGKDIVLQVSGEDTELDKTVIERIGDPLTHLVRNAIDHGIEPAAQRLAQGKPAQGTLHLHAYHESGHIVIEIGDDGGGLDRERILAKGIERGLVDPGRHLSDKEVFNLIFEPGFSTATAITNLSGRGVGMDVVRSNIHALRGTVELSSQAGVGTTVQVRLPLTLAIINGFQVRVGNAIFVIPLEMVDECIEYRGTDTNMQQSYTDLRGRILPFVSLRTYFALQGPQSTRPNIVVIQRGSQRFGVLVDELLGEAQTVIKPLSKLFRHATGISGSSILGNGSVALILDLPVLHNQLLAMAQSDSSTPTNMGAL